MGKVDYMIVHPSLYFTRSIFGRWQIGKATDLPMKDKARLQWKKEKERQTFIERAIHPVGDGSYRITLNRVDGERNLVESLEPDVLLSPGQHYSFGIFITTTVYYFKGFATQASM